MFTFVVLPSNFTSQMASSTQDFLGTFSPVAVIIVSTLLAGLILTMIIHAFTK